MDRRFQIFVSSTYEDLREERQKVIQALLEFDCIPVGMEFFPAADETQWAVIKRVIEECDYYLVILAGRYGSVTPEGISYTQQEYEYAVSKSLPVLAFLHEDPTVIPAGKTELSVESRNKLEDFRALCQKKLCKFWKTPDQLAGTVLTSLNQLIKAHPAVGWVRGDQAADPQAAQQILNLKNQVQSLQLELEQLATQPPSGTDSLSQGEETLMVSYTCQQHFASATTKLREWHEMQEQIRLSWNRLYFFLSPLMIEEASTLALQERLNEAIWQEIQYHFIPELQTHSIRVNKTDLHTIILQFRSLGLITQSIRQRSLKDVDTYWKLTPYGDSLMASLHAIKRGAKS